MIVDCASMMTSAAAITRNEIIRATAISCCFLELYSQTPRLTGTFAVSSDSAGYSSTITEKRHEHRAAADPVVRLLRGWIALPRGGGSEAHIRRALVVVAGSASPLGSVGPQHLIYSGRLYWLFFVSQGPPEEEDITIREDPPHRYEFAAMLCFLLFAHNLLGRLEGAGQRMWEWLGTGQWQLLLLFGLLSLICQLLFWSEVVQMNHGATRRT